ncbi:MAG: hypothetical protein J5X22_17240 [Candidatus Accumulibacter sp.]|nr:hypothetical protein [Accumulibacter sp.]MBO3712163.1 hypothetical protein [Accumulibacter sp.]
MAMIERFLAIMVMTGFLLIPWAIERGQGIFAPLRTYSILSFVTTVPYLLLLSFDPSVMYPPVAQHIRYNEFNDLFLKYTFVQGVAYLCVFAGYLTAGRLSFGWVSSAGMPRVSALSEGTVLRAAVIALLLGMALWIVQVQLVGGLEFLLLNLGDRTSLTAGLGYLSTAANAMLAFSVLLMAYSFQYGNGIGKKICLALFFVIAAISYTVFGGRKHLLHLLLMLLLTWHYSIRKIYSVRPSHIALGFFVAFYFVSVLLLRQGDALEYYMNRPGELLADVLDNVNIFVIQLSYVDTYMFIIKHFDQNDYWWGRSYIDLLYAPIPSTLFPDKPPVDDGVYIRSLMEGWNVIPPTPFWKMYPSSTPPETIGIGYASAGLLGVVIGMFILGMIIRSSYSFMMSRRTFFSLYVFLMVLLNFQLTNLRLAQFLTSFLIAWMFCGVMLRYRRSGRFARLV